MGKSSSIKESLKWPRKAPPIVKRNWDY